MSAVSFLATVGIVPVLSFVVTKKIRRVVHVFLLVLLTQPTALTAR